MSVPDVRQCPKAIMLQFEKEVRVVEGLANKGQLGGIHSARAHINMMQSKRGGAKRIESEILYGMIARHSAQLPVFVAVRPRSMLGSA